MCYTGEGLVYVLHCFTKKTNATSPNDTKIEPQTLSELKQRLTKTKKH
jgi:phage-related protein